MLGSEPPLGSKLHLDYCWSGFYSSALCFLLRARKGSIQRTACVGLESIVLIMKIPGLVFLLLVWTHLAPHQVSTHQLSPPVCNTPIVKYQRCWQEGVVTPFFFFNGHNRTDCRKQLISLQLSSTPLLVGLQSWWSDNWCVCWIHQISLLSCDI